MAAILMVGSDIVDDLGNRASPTIGLSNLVYSSIPCIASLHQLLNSQPHHPSPVVLLLDSIYPIASFSGTPILAWLPSTNSKLILFPELGKGSRCRR